MSSPSRSQLLLFLACLLAAGLGQRSVLGASLDASLTEAERRSQQREALLVIELLQAYHYSERPFRDFSVRELIERYADVLDPGRCLMLTSDIDFLAKRFERSLKPVYLFKGDLRPAYEIHALFLRRAEEWGGWVDRRLKERISFSENDRISIDRLKEPRPASQAAQLELFERSLKSRLLGELLKGTSQEKAVATVLEGTRDYLGELRQTPISQVRERFLSCLLGLFDPHSSYFSRDSAELLEMEMSGVMVGIGLDLRQRKDRFYVRDVHPGGPADLNGGVHPGDELVSLAEKDGPVLRLEGRGARDVSRLLSGSDGTELCLTLRSGKGAPLRQLSLVRGKVNLGLSRARGELYILPGKGGERRLGVLQIPSFYGTEEGASMSADVRELLGEFAKEGVEGLVIDLRNNRGGLIHEAVSLAGLFLRTGPVAMSKGLDSKVVYHRDEDPAVAFDGPLVILTSRVSASASELFTGALQCHGRALVVGEDRSFGKGSMQSSIDLRKAFDGSLGAVQAHWGMVRVTQQLTFLPDGSSPQLQGLRPDIVLATYERPGFKIEADLPGALPPPRLAPAPTDEHMLKEIAGLNRASRERLLSLSGQRMASLQEHDYLRRASAWYNTLVGMKDATLNLEEARRQIEQQDREWSALNVEYRNLRGTLGLKPKRIQLPALRETSERHQQALRRRLLPDGRPCINRYFQGVFYFEEAPGGKIRELALRDIEFDASLGDAEAFARSWTELLGRSVSADRMRELLKELARPRHQEAEEEAEERALFAPYAGENLAPADLDRAIDAFLLRAAQNDHRERAGVPYLDITLREGLRCCADWLALRTSETSP